MIWENICTVNNIVVELDINIYKISTFTYVDMLISAIWDYELETKKSMIAQLIKKTRSMF